ncbi:hypothetical protein KLP28_08655 [Nocardioidaceae bacterium]|nr:hypothetical protein KLP28_08655 [Nocardioidaceae bacterium]
MSGPTFILSEDFQWSASLAPDLFLVMQLPPMGVFPAGDGQRSYDGWVAVLPTLGFDTISASPTSWQTSHAVELELSPFGASTAKLYVTLPDGSRGNFPLDDLDPGWAKSVATAGQVPVIFAQNAIDSKNEISAERLNAEIASGAARGAIVIVR